MIDHQPGTAALAGPATASAPDPDSDGPAAAGRAAQLLNRAVQLIRRFADDATDATGCAYWFPDQSQFGRFSVITEHLGTYVNQDVPEGVAQHVARFDPNMAVAIAGIFDHAAQEIRATGRIGDRHREVKAAQQYLRGYGELT